MSTIILRVVSSNGALQPSKTFAPIRGGTPSIKLTGASGAYVSYPTNVPTLTSSIADLSKYSNTEQMLANDASTYANAIAFVQNSYINASSLKLSSLTDVNVVEPIANNSTLVYDTSDNKYTVKQLDLDGGNF